MIVQIFASTSGHPILLKAIEKMVKTLLRQNTLLGRALRFSPLQAHPQAPTKHVSGSTVLTDAIRSALQLSKSVDAIDIMNLILIDDEVHTRARNLRLCFMNSRVLSEVVQSKVS